MTSELSTDQNKNHANRSPILESQIESMLNKIMSEDLDPDSNTLLNFQNSDEESSDVDEKNDTFFNNDKLSKGIRNRKKCSTLSLNTEDEPCFVGNTFHCGTQAKNGQGLVMFKQMIPKYNYYNHLGYNNNYNSNANSTACSENEMYILQNMSNMSNFSNLSCQNKTFNMLQSYHPLHNSSLNLVNDSFYHQQIFNNNRSFNVFNKDKEKRFGTISIPKDTNMKVEMLLFELNTALQKSEKIDYYIYNKLQGNFTAILKTHKGSRIFQSYLKNTHTDIIHQIFFEIKDSLPLLICDSYANYFCKKFFSYLNQKDRISFLQSIQTSFVKLSLDSIGTYPIQGIIELVGSKYEKAIIINAIQSYISEFCVDTYGTHVLIKILSCFEDEFTTFIIDCVKKNFLFLANDPNGICIVKKVLTFTHKKELHEYLKKVTKENATKLIEHPYANYVLQVIIEIWDEVEINEIFCIFKNNFSFLSLQKYSSNVVERYIEKCDLFLNIYIDEICKDNQINEIMRSNYGNYVIQKALKLSKSDNRKKLMDRVLYSISRLNDKKLIAKWKLIVGSLTLQ